MSSAHLDEILDSRLLHQHSLEQLENGRMMAKLGLAALIVDPELRIFVSCHEGVAGMFADDAMGTAMETFKYVPDRGAVATETPREVFVRCMSEEFACDKERFNAAGFYIDRQHPLFHGEWSAGPRGNYNDYFGWTVSLLVYVQFPEVLTSNTRLSKECRNTRFMTYDEIITSDAPKRPGYETWLGRMMTYMAKKIPRSERQELTWTPIVTTESNSDVTYPYKTD